MRKLSLNYLKLKRYFLIVGISTKVIKKSNLYAFRYQLDKNFYIGFKFLKKQLLNIFFFFTSLKFKPNFLVFYSKNLFIKRAVLIDRLSKNILSLEKNIILIHVYYNIYDNINSLNKDKSEKKMSIGFLSSKEVIHLFDYSFFLSNRRFVSIYLFNLFLK